MIRFSVRSNILVRCICVSVMGAIVFYYSGPGALLAFVATLIAVIVLQCQEENLPHYVAMRVGHNCLVLGLEFYKFFVNPKDLAYRRAGMVALVRRRLGQSFRLVPTFPIPLPEYAMHDLSSEFKLVKSLHSRTQKDWKALRRSGYVDQLMLAYRIFRLSQQAVRGNELANYFAGAAAQIQHLQAHGFMAVPSESDE